MVSEWQDENDNWLRFVEDKNRNRIQVQIEYLGDARIFWFDTPGQFGDFVATATEAAKSVYGQDFAEILNVGKDSDKPSKLFGDCIIEAD